ncbi:hypothetical protein GIB67_035140 [Kingdonia uniflora]|uniref:Ribosomal RNA small subunit methyltransferase NEP1 n=1 Tax=Kingdonia uniflora TaxID=39325 RepID=A0A7J7LDL0_9MAGN|nr:hypothetical protein GIB67_035140 [Kingdonia uniflora]
MKIKEVVHDLPGILVDSSIQNAESSLLEDITEVGDEKEEKRISTPTKDDTEIKEAIYDLPGIPVVPLQSSKQPGIIFIFEKASLVPAYVGKTYQILTSDDHANFLRRKKMNPYNYRPDIIHNALLEIMDSTIYKAGRVQGIYVRTEKGVLIKIQPRTRIPRTFRSFCSMMLELLQKLSIKAKGRREKLLRLIENPVTQHLPVNSFKIGLSHSAQKVVRLKDYVGAVNDDTNLVFVVGAMAHGKIECEYADDVISGKGWTTKVFGVAIGRSNMEVVESFGCQVWRVVIKVQENLVGE